MNELLEILQKNARITDEQLAVMTGRTVEDVAAEIKTLQEKNIIAGYAALVNWDKTDRDYVSALIELKINPSNGKGFDAVAEKIAKYPEVRSLYLMSGAFDLAVFVEGKSLKEVAMFVSEKIAQTEEVLSTATHFMLKTYKSAGITFESRKKDDREVITL
ncbi:MAG: Lrp/AsnC family transcriptional regulator [Bacillota bacterium]|nr:Lrp/AsnC family transcriptional regulator [Bacillota bacterium]